MDVDIEKLGQAALGCPPDTTADPTGQDRGIVTGRAVSPLLTRAGHLVLAPSDDAQTLPEQLGLRLVQTFGHSAGKGLLELGLSEAGTALPPAFAFWHDFASRYATTPPLLGGEYLNAGVLESLWGEIDAACREDLALSKQSLQAYLTAHNPAWNLVGRVHFNLAENRTDVEAPFAFIATYTSQLSVQGTFVTVRLQGQRTGCFRRHGRSRLIAAVRMRRLYVSTSWRRSGIGARLDQEPEPELLFRLRGVDAGEGAAPVGKGVAADRILDASKLGEVFGIDLVEFATAATEATVRAPGKRSARRPAKKTESKLRIEAGASYTPRSSVSMRRLSLIEAGA